MSRTKSLFLLLSLCACIGGWALNTTQNDQDDTARKPVSMNLRVPAPGVYAVSIVDKDVVNVDTMQPNIVDCMLDNSPMLRDVNDTVQLRYDFETQQVISGKVKRAFFKVRNPQILTLNPITGERQQYSLDHHQSFNLIGFDIEEGGTILLQATKEDGKDNLVQLEIKKPYFPSLSMRNLLSAKDTMSLPAINEQMLTKSSLKTQQKYFAEIMLDEVVATGSHVLKPMNNYGFVPAKGFNSNDEFLKNANSMDLVITKLGLMIRTDSAKCFGMYRMLNQSWGTRLSFIQPTVYIDHFQTDDMNEVWNLDPQEIQQIEYFPADQPESSIALHATAAGALCIFTKTVHLKRNSMSMQAVHPLGYRPAKTPYNPIDDPEYIPSTDYRATLLWNPEVVVDNSCIAHVTFMPSATSHHYAVTLEGIGNDGEIACSNAHHNDIPTLTDEQEHRIASYLERTPREKAYIQTDRNQYCAGDTVWLRVHIADALSVIPSTSLTYPDSRSKFAYVELHNNVVPDSKNPVSSLVERIMIKRDSLGVFASYIVLPPTLQTGQYTLVTYTRHMLNFPESEIHHKQIQVLEASLHANKQ